MSAPVDVPTEETLRYLDGAPAGGADGIDASRRVLAPPSPRPRPRRVPKMDPAAPGDRAAGLVCSSTHCLRYAAGSAGASVSVTSAATPERRNRFASFLTTSSSPGTALRLDWSTP